MITQFKPDGSKETKPEHIDYADALNSVTWYNGLAEYVVKWAGLEPDINSIKCPDHYCATENTDSFVYEQLQVLWMIAVNMFGDYGTSPRFGWIEDVAAFRLWVSDITKTYRYRNTDDEDDE